MSNSSKYIPPPIREKIWEERISTIRKSKIGEYLELSGYQEYPRFLEDIRRLDSIIFWKFNDAENQNGLNSLLEKYNNLAKPLRNNGKHITPGAAKFVNMASTKGLKKDNGVYGKVLVEKNIHLAEKFDRIFIDRRMNKKIKEIHEINPNATINLAKIEENTMREILNERANELNECSNLLAESNSIENKKKSQFFKEQSNREREKEKDPPLSIENRIKSIQFSNFNLKLSNNITSSINQMIECPKGWTIQQLELFKTKYLSKIKNKIFLLGSTDMLQYFVNFRSLFHLLPAYSNEHFVNKNILKVLDNKIHCKWSVYLNFFFLYIIKYSQNDITGIVVLPKNKVIPKIRESTSPEYILQNKLKFIGFIIIPFKKYYKNTPGKYVPTNEYFIAIFENTVNNKFILYSINLILILEGHFFPVHTILYDELKGLFNYLNKYGNKINAFYDPSFPQLLFLSNKEKKYIIDNYKNMVEVEYKEIKDTKQFQFIKTNNNNPILQSIPFDSSKTFTPINQHGGNIYFDKVLFSNIKLLISFQNYLLTKYKSVVLIDFIDKYYNEFKLIENKNIIGSYTSKKKDVKQDKKKNYELDVSKYIINKEDKHFINTKIYSVGYFDSIQLLYQDSLKFNNNLKICEISILPSCFEVLKKFNVDVFYNNNNYYNYNIKNWKKLINNYKLHIPNNINFIYDKSQYLVNSLYDIVILNLIKNLDFNYNNKNIKEEPTEFTKYSTDTILKYVKKQLKYIDYVKIGGTCYFKIHNLWTNDIIDIYYEICTLFKNVDIFIPKYKCTYKKLYGGVWLKCYNKLKTPKKIDKEKLFKKVDEFNSSTYSKMIDYFYNLDTFIDKKLNNDNLKLEVEIFYMQLDTAINFCNDYSLEINPKWKDSFDIDVSKFYLGPS